MTLTTYIISMTHDSWPVTLTYTELGLQWTTVLIWIIKNFKMSCIFRTILCQEALGLDVRLGCRFSGVSHSGFCNSRIPGFLFVTQPWKCNTQASSRAHIPLPSLHNASHPQHLASFFQSVINFGRIVDCPKKQSTCNLFSVSFSFLTLAIGSCTSHQFAEHLVVRPWASGWAC